MATEPRDDRPTLEGFRASSIASLERTARSTGCGERWVVADASMGSWRAHHLATELADQLGVTLANSADGRAALATRDRAPSLSEIIGAGVDAEARGDDSVRAAILAAERLADAARAASGVLVLTPRLGHVWRREEARFVALLAGALAARGIPFRLVVTDARQDLETDAFRVRIEDGPLDPPHQQAGKSLWSLLPGLADAALVESFAARGEPPPVDAPTLPNGARLVPPELRPPRADTSRSRFDKLAVAVAGDWREAYAQLHGNNIYVDGRALAREAWAAFSLGAVDLALTLLRRAVDCAPSPPERAVLESQAQGMRIAALRFAEAAQGTIEPTVAPSLRAFLSQSKAWGMVMTGRAAEADPLLLEARELAAIDEDTVEYMYLLNISALAKLRQGAWDEALAFEERIASEVRRLGHEDARLEYINALNMARLHRRSGALTRAKELYLRAFATTRGLRSESDLVYVNATMAMLAQAAGDLAEADRAWMRAALHWLAADTPEASGGRAATAIVGRSPSDREDIVDLVSASLAQRWGETGRRPEPAEGVRICRSEDAPFVTSVVLGDGYAVMAAANPPGRPARPHGPAHSALAALVSGRLAADAGARALAGAPAIVVDDRFGDEVPTCAIEAIELGVARGCEQIVMGGESIALPASTRAALAARATLELAPGVAALEGEAADAVRVRFRRYLEPVRLSGAPAAVALAARGRLRSDRVADAIGLGAEHADAIFAALRARRVVLTTLTEEACEEAGFKLPLSATSPRG